MMNMSSTAIDSAVKIQGTNYDRKRKVTKSMKHRMEQMYTSGKSYSYIAEYFGVTPYTVRYNLDEDFRYERNKKRNDYARNYTPTKETVEDSVEYRKELLKNRNFRRAVPVYF